MTPTPYTIVLYGTNEYFASDSKSEVAKSSVTGVTYSSKSVGVYTIYPFHREDIEVKSRGDIQRAKVSQYRRYKILTARAVNTATSYSDVTGTYEDLMTIFRYKYLFLEVTSYIRALHTTNKLIKVVPAKREIVEAPGRVWLEMELEKERPE